MPTAGGRGGGRSKGPPRRGSAAGRGRGAGAALAALCEERAREHGATAMVLSSLPDMTHAHRIYTRLGYRRDPSRDWDPVPGVHLIAFAKELP